MNDNLKHRQIKQECWKLILNEQLKMELFLEYFEKF